ncbi:MAG: MMPL family transporter [Deltaproteobacteria bacterium]|nr:MMPL family transporter [Deltaproteobacteria bacterium]
MSSPRILLGFLIAVIGFAATQLASLRADNDVHLYVDTQEPQKAIHEHAVSTFASDHEALIAYRSPDIFSTKTLHTIRSLGEQLEQLEITRGGKPFRFVRKVTSLLTVNDVVGEELSFRVERLVPAPVPTSTRALASLRERANRSPVIREMLISADGESGLVFARCDASLDSVETQAAAQKIMDLTQRVAAEDSSIEFLHSGRVIANGVVNHYAKRDLERLTGVSYLVMAILLLLFIRTAWGMVVGLFSLGVSLAAAMATLAAIGGVVSSATLLLPPLILMLTMAHLVHFFSELGENAHLGGDAARRTLASVVPPAFMATVTDAIGFGSLGWSTIPTIRDLGFAAAVAVMVSFFVCLSASTLVWRRVPVDRFVALNGVGRAEWFGRALEGTYGIVSRHTKAVLMTTLALAAASAYFAAKITTDTDPLMDFVKADTTLVKEIEAVRDLSARADFYTLVLRSGRDDYFLDRKALEELEALELMLRSELRAPVVISVVSYLKLMNRAFFADDPARYTLPETREQAAQLLLMNDDKVVHEYLSRDGRDVRLLVGLPRDVVTTHSERRIFQAAEAFLQTRFPKEGGVDAQVTGIARLWEIGLSAVTDTQRLSLGSSVLMMFLLLGIVFRSPTLALCAFPPNLLPILMTFGLMGIIGIPLNATTALIGGIVLGISIDDTTHLLYAYREYLRESGDAAKSLERAFMEKGRAMIWTTLVLCLGTIVFLGAGYFKGTSDAGLLMSAAIFFALLCDLFTLPALVLSFRPRFGVRPGSGARQVS